LGVGNALVCLTAGTILLACPAAAQKIDKPKLLELTRRNCPTRTMQNKELVDILLIGGGDLSKFCECFAVRFVTQLDDTDYGNEQAISSKLMSSQNFCLAASIK
jgi:hypothetical protein